MKKTLSLGAALLALGTSAFGQIVYQTDFSTTPAAYAAPEVGELAGQNTWTMPTNAPNTGANGSPHLSFITNDIGGTAWGALGGLWSQPNRVDTEVNQTLGSPASLTNLDIDLDVVLVESTATYPNRDGFGVSFRDSGGNPVFRTEFRPGATPGARNIWYSIGSGAFVNSLVAAPTHSGTGVPPLTPISLEFRSGTLSGTISNFAFSGAVTNTDLGSFGADFDAGAAAIAGLAGGLYDVGDNYMAFDNIMISIPEPSTTLLFGASLAALGLRRRRQ